MINLLIKISSYVISCATGMYITFDFLDKMYSTIVKNKIILYFVFTTLWFLTFLLNMPILKFSYFIISILYIWYFIYKIKSLSELIHIIIYIVSYAGCDNIISSLLSTIIGSFATNNSNSIFLFFNVLAVQVFMLIISKLLLWIFRKESLKIIYKKQYIFLLTLPISNIVITYIVAILATFKYNPSILKIVMILMALLTIIINLAVIYFFENILKTNQLEKDNYLMKQQIKMQYEYYYRIEKKYENSQKIMHDIKNHLHVIENLKNKNERHNYVKNLEEIVDSLSEKFKTSNKILNIIINEKIEECESNNINFIHEVENVNMDYIEDIDITTIFANLFDNAIEACKKIRSGNKQIELRIYRFNNMLIINLINSTEIIPQQNNNKFTSSKENHKAIGISNVEATVHKYNGDINIRIEQNSFIVSIIIPI